MKNLPLQFALSAKKFLLQRLPEKKPLRSSLLLAFSKNPLCFLSSLFPPEKHHPLPSVTETLHISPQTRPKSNSFLQPQASTTPHAAGSLCSSNLHAAGSPQKYLITEESLYRCHHLVCLSNPLLDPSAACQEAPRGLLKLLYLAKFATTITPKVGVYNISFSLMRKNFTNKKKIKFE